MAIIHIRLPGVSPGDANDGSSSPRWQLSRLPWSWRIRLLVVDHGYIILHRRNYNPFSRSKLKPIERLQLKFFYELRIVPEQCKKVVDALILECNGLPKHHEHSFDGRDYAIVRR